MKTFKVTLVLLLNPSKDDSKKSVEYIVKANSEAEAKSIAKRLDKSYLSVWESYAEEIESISHTKGEWAQSGTSVFLGGLIEVSQNIENCLKTLELTQEAEANAKLIAASPIMFSYIKKRAELGDNDAKLIVTTIE
jgi:hypothetical protein